MSAVSIRGARKRFGDPDTGTPVLDGIDLDVAAGEFVAIVGASGCGKSTLLHAAAGFERLDAGEVQINGVPVTEPSRRHVYVAQEPSVFPWFTVVENIAFGLRDLAPSEIARRVQEHVALVGLQGFEDAYPYELSGGMKQRLEFARALAVDPAVLLLDEPFGALDAITRLQMRREILRIWIATRTTCVLVTHDVDEACELADRVCVLSPRPARILEILPIALERPRSLDAPEVRDVRSRVYGLLRVDR